MKYGSARIISNLKRGKSLVAIELKEGKFNALVIYGKAEREVFEQKRGEFSSNIQDYYENSCVYQHRHWLRRGERASCYRKTDAVIRAPSRSNQ
jgi:hypothetical protein